MRRNGRHWAIVAALLVVSLFAMAALAACGEDAGEEAPPPAQDNGETDGQSENGVSPPSGSEQDGELEQPVSAAELAAPEVSRNADQWPLPNQNYANTRAAAAVITSANVDDLGVAWEMAIPGESIFGAAAGGLVVLDDTVYFQDLASNLFVVDLHSGEQQWSQIYDMPIIGPTGPAVGNGQIYISKGSQEFVALDAESGEEMWSVAPELGYFGVHQAMPLDGKVLFGSGAGEGNESGYAPGRSGMVHAVEAGSGERIWSFRVVASEDFWGHPEINSGGGVWYPGAIDLQSGLAVYGTGNPAPFPGIEGFPNGESRPGPNLYTSSLIGLDTESGELAWHHQAAPHDLFDLDLQAPPILTEMMVDGEMHRIVLGAGKVGDVLAYDLAQDAVLWRTEVGMHQNDDLEAITPGEEVSVYPGILGGVETPMALADGVVYVPVVNIPTTHTATGWGATTGVEALNNANAHTNVADGAGELVALDVATGDELWTQRFDSPVFGGATVSGDLVFTATFDGMMRALDRESGEQVWSMQAPAGINAWPAILDDMIVWAAGSGTNPALFALQLGAAGGFAAPEDAAPDGGAEATTADVELTEYNVSSPTPPAPAGTVTFAVTNAGTMVHNFNVIRTDLAPEELPLTDDGSRIDVESDAVQVLGETPNLDPGDTGEVTADLAPGRYILFCNIPGHFGLGMYTSITVE